METDQDLLKECAKYTSCLSCVQDHACGYFGSTNACVPGGWLSPHQNHTSQGEPWSYYHGHCFVSTRVEFVLLPAILGMLVLAAAIVSLWRCWPYKWHESPNGQCPYLDPEGCSSDGGEGSGHRQHDEHTPLLIDNDPRSRPSRVRAPTGSTALRPEPIEAAMESHRHRAEHAWMGSSPAGASFEEQYGSWCQRSGNMVQGATPNAG